MATDDNDTLEKVDWSVLERHPWWQHYAREAAVERQKADSKRGVRIFRCIVTIALFAALGGLVALAHVDNYWNLGLGTALALFGIAAGLYELKVADGR